MLIIKIAKAELRSIFYSPVAWFISITFLFLWGTAYTSSMVGLANMQEAAMKYSPGFRDFGDLNIPFSLTSLLLGSPEGMGMGVFPVAIKYLFLFIPLLTMGLISRELNAGTDKLLFSSPVRLRQIVLGKFLGMVVYNLLLLAIIGIFFLSLCITVISPDFGLLFSSMLGLLLMMCTYSAIGMFMSSLTSYQVVSAIGAFIVLALLNNLGYLWQRIDLVRDLTYMLSLSGRGEKMLLGLITSKDLIYFLLVIAMFVCFTIIRLKGRRESKAWYITPGRYALVLVLVLFAGYISSRPSATVYWDATAADRNTLPDNIRTIIQQLDKGPLEVTIYTNLVGDFVDRGLPENRNKYLSMIWEPYLRFKPDIHFNYVYYYDYTDGGGPTNMPESEELTRTAKAVARRLKLDMSIVKKPDEIRKMITLKEEAAQTVAHLQYNGKSSFLHLVGINSRESVREQIEAAALKQLLQPGPRIYFVEGNYERRVLATGERDFAFHATYAPQELALVHHGFTSDTLTLENRDIPADATALVLADPRSALSITVMNKLRKYVADGGNMLVMGEPGKQELLAPLLNDLGVTMLGGQMVQPSKDETPDKVLPDALKTVTTISRDLADHYNRQQRKGLPFQVLMPGATALAVNPVEGFTAKPLLENSPKNAWLRKGRLVVDSAEVFFDPKEGDTATVFPMMFGLTRQLNGKEQRIIVAGDADFMSNKRFGNNAPFVTALYSWMNYDEYPVYAPRKSGKDNLLYISRKAATVQRFIFTWILPELCIILAAIFLIRRKRK